MKKYFKIFLAIFFLLIVSIGGYFLADRSGFFSKREINYAQPIVNLESEKSLESEIAAEDTQTENVDSSAKSVETPQEEKTEAIKDEPVAASGQEKPVEKKVVEPEKPTEAKGEVGKIVDKLVSWGFVKSSGRKIDTIIVHSSYNSLGGDVFDPDKIIAIYKQYEVSAHYLIARDGVIYRLVQEKDISWHAGVSKVPDGRTNVNDFSIGIEMINTMDGKYTSEQYEALNSLLGTLKKKYEIKYILGHNEIAPGRKTDPWGIDWKKVNR